MDSRRFPWNKTTGAVAPPGHSNVIAATAAPVRTPETAKRSWGLPLLPLFLVAVLVAWPTALEIHRPDLPVEDPGRARVQELVRRLSAMGPRAAGQASYYAAADYLAAELRQIPRLEVDRHVTAGMKPLDGVSAFYRVTNVIARLPGESVMTILFSAHFDTTATSPGAADNGVAVATLVELARVLSAKPRLRYTYVFNLNGGEEIGTVGALAFVQQHRWFGSPAAIINLDAAGTAGAPILFRASDPAGPLVQLYASLPEHPRLSSVGDVLLRSGLLPFGTDFEPYARAAPVPVLDIALIEGSHTYHTALDTEGTLDPGSLTALLTLVVSLASRIDQTPTLAGAAAAAPIYYSLSDWAPFVYGARTGEYVGLSVAFLALALVLGVVRVERKGPRGAVVMAARTALGVVAGMCLAAAMAAAIVFLLGMPLRWFANQTFAVVGYTCAAIAGYLALHEWAWRRDARRRNDYSLVQRVSGALLFWLTILAISLALRTRLSYLSLWPVACLALGLLSVVASSKRGWRVAAWVVCSVGGWLVIAEPAAMVLRFLGGAGTWLRLPVPFDIIIACVSATAVACGLSILIPWVGDRDWRMPILVAGTLAVVSLAASLAQFPFTRQRPYRIVFEENIVSTQRKVFVYGAGSMDFVRDVLSPNVPLSAADRRGNRQYVLAVDTAVPTPRCPAATVNAGEPAEGRAYQLNLEPHGAHEVLLEAPAETFDRWSMEAGEGAKPVVATTPTLVLRGLPGGVQRVTLQLKQPASIVLRVRSFGFASTPSMAPLMRALPDWATVETVVTCDAQVAIGRN